jgi:hypothetical protein
MAKNEIKFSIVAIDKATSALKKIGAALKTFLKVAATGFAALAAGVRLAVKSVDQLGKTAKVIGISAEALQELRHAAELAGVSNLGLDDSLRRMQRRMGEFINSGAGPAVLALQKLNIKITDTAGNFIGTERAFNLVVRAMEDIDGVAQKSALAAQLFGDDYGPKLVPLLNQGLDAINKQREAFRELGLVISDEAVAKMEKVEDQITILSSVLKQKLLSAVADNAEAIFAFTSFMTDFAIATLKAANSLAKLFGVGEVNKAKKDLKEYQETALGLFRVETEGLDIERLTRLPGVKRIDGTIRTWKEFNEEVVAPQQQLVRELEEKGRQAAASFSDGFADGLSGIEDGLGGFENDPLETLGISESVDAFQERIRDRIDKLRQSYWDEAQRDAKQMAEKTDKSFEFMKAAAEGAAQSMQSAFAEFFMDFDGGLKGLAQSFLQVIRQMIAQVLAFKAMDFFNVGGFFNRLVGRASGGGVMANTPYIVGERGPELFIPSGAGTIRNNASLKGGGSSPQFVTNIDARGADPGLIARLPQILEARDRRLLMAVQRFSETGVMPV